MKEGPLDRPKYCRATEDQKVPGVINAHDRSRSFAVIYFASAGTMNRPGAVHY